MHAKPIDWRIEEARGGHRAAKSSALKERDSARCDAP
jgi:hypothetical protein